MPPTACLNCGAALESGQRYCRDCGQKADTHRVTLHDIVHAAVHMVTHADHSVFGLVRDLILRPGHVARAYVEGRRKHYFNPFTFLLVIVGVASLVLKTSKFVDFTTIPANPVSSFLQAHLNLLILVQVPLLALFGRLLFRADQLYFAEHLVLASYASGFRSIFFTLVIAPAWLFFQWPHRTTLACYLALWVAYYALACAQFYRGERWLLALKGLAVALLTQLVTLGATSGAIWAWFKFFRPG